MRRLFFSGLALLIGAPAGWIITQEAPQNNEASAPQDAPATQQPVTQPPATQPPAPQPPTAPRPPIKGVVLPKVDYDIATDPFGGRFFVPRNPVGNQVDGLRGYAAGVRRTNTDPNEPKARQLAAQIRATEDESARKALLVELEALTGDSFETMMRSRREQIAKVEQRVAEITARLDERQQLKSEIVKRRVAELLNQPDPLSWETPADFLAVDPPARFPTPARGTAANDPFGGGSGLGFGGAGGGGAGSFGGGSGGGAGGVGNRGPANRLPARTQQESELARLQAELAARRAQLAAQEAVLQEELRAIEREQAKAREIQQKALQKERAKFEQDSNN